MITLRNSAQSPKVLVAGVIGAICLLSLFFPGLVKPLEMLTYDARMRLVASISDRSHFSSRLATVLIDDAAMRQVNNGSLAEYYAPATNLDSAQKLFSRDWPWPRFIHGQLVRELSAQGATAACFDILFPNLSERREEETVAGPYREEKPVEHFVRRVTGPVEFSTDEGKTWKPLRMGMKLRSNWVLQTGAGASVELFNPDQRSAIRVTERTRMSVGATLLTPVAEVRIGDAFVSKGRLSSDEFFAQQMRQAGNVSLATESEGVIPADLFLTNAAGLGSIRLEMDARGVMRRVKPFQEIREWHPLIRELLGPLDLRIIEARVVGGRLIVPRSPNVEPDKELESLALPLNSNGSLKLTRDGAIDFADDPQDNGPETEFPFRLRRVWNLGFVMAAKVLQFDLEKAEATQDGIFLIATNGLRRFIPLDAEGNMKINWLIRYQDLRERKLPIYNGSIAELLSTDKYRTSGQPGSMSAFSNRAVLIGPAATGSALTDIGTTPVEGGVPMVMSYLNVANSILTGRLLQETSSTTNLALIALTGVAAAGIGFLMRPVWASVAGVLLAALYVVIAIAVFMNYLYVLPIAMPVGCALLVTHVCILVERVDPMTVARRFFSRAGFRKIESMTPTVLHLHPNEGETAALATLWTRGSEKVEEELCNAVQIAKRKGAGELKIYLVYQREGPPSTMVQQWRQKLGCEIIPLLGAMLEKTSPEHGFERRLRQLEEPYLIRADPYAEFKPIADPMWFYGRQELLQRLPALLAQGQHAGVFGLRKVGKTSLTNQLRERFVSTPSAFLDCQGLPSKAESYFDAIYRELHAGVKRQGITRLPKLEKITDATTFRERIVELFGRWRSAGRHEPFVLIFDEIDKFFPNPEIAQRDEILAEYVRVFRVIRDLAQRCHCFVACVIAYRPTVNRQNILTAEIGENPMFSSFQEIYLGFLNASESEAMVREIGLWKNIYWEENAARHVFEFCGGHPLITRHFASWACQRGNLKVISETRVLETAIEVEKTLRKNEIGNYYREAIGNLLLPEEQRLLNVISQAGESGHPDERLSPTEEEALSNLENFGLVKNENGRLRITAGFFRAWLDRRANL